MTNWSAFLRIITIFKKKLFNQQENVYCKTLKSSREKFKIYIRNTRLKVKRENTFHAAATVRGLGGGVGVKSPTMGF